MLDSRAQQLGGGALERRWQGRSEAERGAPDAGGHQGEAGPVPLAPEQERLWFLEQLDPGAPLYTISRAFLLTGPLDEEALRRGLHDLVERHEALRSSFDTVEGEPRQTVRPPPPVPVTVADLRHLSPADADAEAARLCTEEGRRPLDLATVPLVRPGLIRMGPDRNVLQLTTHHMVVDGWSLAILLRELGELYEARRAGRPPALPDLPVRYRDHVLRQRRWLAQPEAAAEVAWWRDRIGSRPAATASVLEGCTDRPRPAVQSFRGRHRRFHLSRDDLAAVLAIGRQERATPFMTLLAAFATWLHRHCGRDDLTVGTPMANRTRLELEGVVGMFVNTLLLPIELGGDPTFRELVRRVRDVAREAYAHAEAPFDRVVRAVAPERDPSQAPLFQVMFQVQDASMSALRLPGLDARPLEIEKGTSLVDLSLDVVDEASGTTGVVEYSTDLFDDETITRWVQRLHVLLAGIAVDPDAYLHDLPFLPAAERDRLVVGWNRATGAAGASGASIPAIPRAGFRVHHLVEDSARRTPERPAVRDVSERLSYGALDARANRLANHLVSLGVEPDRPVAVCLEHSVDMVVAILAVLKAGGAYVPLDASHPRDRIAHILADAGLPLVVTRDELVHRLPVDPRDGLVRLDADAEALEAADASAPSVPGIAPEHLAYVIYTSGSTGRPKGVAVSHGSLVNLLSTMRDTVPMGPDDTLLALATPSFDVATFEVLFPLVTGARLVVTDRAARMDGRRLAKALEASGASFVQATPTTWHLLRAAGWNGRPNLTILSAGEALPRDLADFLLARCRTLVNLYGPTEVTIYSTATWVAAQEGPVPIGRPVADTTAYVLDRHGGLVPQGTSGELYLGGPGLARGYVGRPDLTAERFVPDPFGPPGGRLYRSGDLVRHRPDGALEFLGRLDQQVKLRGHRIELEEIEAVFRSQPGVAACVVDVLGEGPWVDPRLVAYVVAGDQGSRDGWALREAVGTLLPAYMLPWPIVFVDAIPTSPNGKADRAALARFVPAVAMRDESPAQAEAPSTELERTLASIWRLMLQVERIGAHDNFFELGGHSFLALRMATMAGELLGVDVPVATVFAHPTVSSLASAIERLGPQPVANEGANTVTR